MIRLRKLKTEDIPYRVKRLNDPLVNQFVGAELGEKTTLRQQQAWFDLYEKDKTKIFFMICDQSKPIGYIGLSNISQINRNADLHIMIGEIDYQRKGIGKIAVEQLLPYGFEKLNLHKINAGVVKDNLPAVKLYLSLGFVIEGDMKDEVWYQGKFGDVLSMAVFTKNKLQ